MNWGGVQPPTIPTLIIAFIAKDPTTPQVCRYTTLWNVSDQWGGSMKRCDSNFPTQWRSPALAGWLSWIVDVYRPSAEGHPRQRNRLDSSPGCLGATCQARWKWRSHAAGTSVCSSSSQEPRLTANITVNMFSVAVYYLTSVQDASATPGTCSSTAHRHTLLGTHDAVWGCPSADGLSASSSSKADALNIRCKNCMMWQLL